MAEQLPTKSAKGDPAALQLTGESLKDFSGEEAPEARADPAAGEAGEEAGAAIKTIQMIMR